MGPDGDIINIANMNKFRVIQYLAGDAKEGSQPEMYRSVGTLSRQDPREIGETDSVKLVI